MQKALDELSARRKLNLRLRSNFLRQQQLHNGELAEVFSKGPNDRRGKWSSARSVLKINADDGYITVSGRFDKTRNVAFEDVRNASSVADLTSSIQNAIGEIDDAIEEIVQYDEVTDGT